MPMSFTINGDTANEIATAIVSFAAVLREDIEVVIPPKQKSYKADATKIKNVDSSVANPAPTTDNQTVDAEPAAENAEPSFTLEQVRKEATDAAKVHGREALKTLLSDLGAAGLTELQAAQYPEFMTRLKALGGGNA